MTLASVVQPFRAIARYAPTQRLALLVALSAPVWLVSRNYTGQALAAGVIAIVALAALVDALRVPGTRHIALERRLPGTVGFGDSREGHYVVSSAWPAQLRFRIFHRPPAGISAEIPPSEFALIPGVPVEIPIAITGRARGIHDLGPVAAVVRGPWGLVRRSIIYLLNDTISVLPSTTGAGRYRLIAAQHRVRTLGSRMLRRRGAGSAFANLREYVPGDDPRHIDWKASARRNRLISREFTIEQGQTVVIAIDSGRMMTQLAGDRERFEYALSSALTLADVALSAGDRVGLIVFDASVRRYIAPSREPGTIGAIRDALVGVTATMSEPDYAAAFRMLAERNRRRSLIVLFTDVVDPRSSRAVITLTSRSAERHLPLVVALRNEQLVRAAVPSPGTTDESSYESVAAEELIAAREEALQGMRMSGVAVLDTPPAAMTAALINRYLEIKERAGL